MSTFDVKALIDDPSRVTLSGVPEGLDGLILGDYARALAAKEGACGLIVHVARDDQRLAALEDSLAFFAADVDVLRFPAWDCQPFDRVSPHGDIVSRRMSTLARLAKPADGADRARVVLTTVNAVVQRVPKPAVVTEASWMARPGNLVSMDELTEYLIRNGFSRTGTVVEPGDYAVRGGIIDIVPPGRPQPVRLDLFGDTLESVRTFDPETQRTTGQLRELELLPASEILLNKEVVRRFRGSYVSEFGAVTDADPLYESISQGRRFEGMEHWLPLFHDGLATLFDYVDDAPFFFDHLSDDARSSRREQIEEYFEARRTAMEQSSFGAPPYKPLAPDALYLPDEGCKAAYAIRDS